MTAKQFRRALTELGLVNRERAAEFLRLTSRSLRTYATKGAPPPVAMLLCVMLAEHISVEEVNEIMSRKGRKA